MTSVLPNTGGTSVRCTYANGESFSSRILSFGHVITRLLPQARDVGTPPGFLLATAR